MLHIDQYSFGKMTIDGTTYTSDVIIYPDRVDSSWRRLEGHCLQRDDLRDILIEQPAILVIGTGRYGVMKVPDELINALREAGIILLIEKTGRAVEKFNGQPSDKKVIGAFHLTC